MFYLGFSGSRDVQSYHFPKVAQEVENLPFTLCLERMPYESMTLVHGCARGLDALVPKLQPTGLKLPSKKFEANWDKYGRSAGFRRNREMVDFVCNKIDEGHSGAWIGFRIRELACKGTEHCLSYAKERGLDTLMFELGIMEGITREFMGKTHTEELVRLALIAGKGPYRYANL